ncbi:MAG: hypothetical protein Q7U36_04055 [bacterium]|nr:hypothetical protein [bacterium]
MKNIMGKIAVLVFIVAFLAIDFGNGIFFARVATDAADIQDDISNVQDKIEDVQKKLEQSQGAYNQNQSQIVTTASLLTKTKTEITRTESEIESLNKNIELNKKILKGYIQEMSFDDQADELLSFITAGNLLSEFSGNYSQMISVKEKTLDLIAEINKDKEDLSGAKEQLDVKKEDHEKLLAIKQMEQQEIKAEIQDAKTTLSQLSSKLDKLRSTYSELLGKSVSTKDIVEAAKFAASATGMNKSFLLGVLIQESNKGQSTGSCNFKQSNMSSAQATAFKSICKDLGYDYAKQKVSCPPKSYKGTGGAMGVPQFMPTTWQGWKGRIASATSHSKPDPWNLVDGVTAMALKLSADGASKKTRFAEAKSYCVYLAGGNWGYYCFGSDKYKSSYNDVNCWGSSIKNYGEKVLCLKDNYEKYY